MLGTQFNGKAPIRRKQMDIEYPVYTIVGGEKCLTISEKSKEEAERTFALLKTRDYRYKNARIEWQSTFFDDEPMIGTIVK